MDCRRRVQTLDSPALSLTRISDIGEQLVRRQEIDVYIVDVERVFLTADATFNDVREFGFRIGFHCRSVFVRAYPEPPRLQSVDLHQFSEVFADEIRTEV